MINKTRKRAQGLGQDTSRNYWSDISGRMRLYGTQKQNGRYVYSVSLGVKREDEEWDNMYYNVRFRKGEDPRVEGGCFIDISKGFLTFDRYENSKGVEVTVPAVVVLDYELEE